jgi:hypothetical protein
MWKLTLGYCGSRLANARKAGRIWLIACQYLNKERKESGIRGDKPAQIFLDCDK